MPTLQGSSAHSATKWAVVGFTQTLAIELGEVSHPA
jgi:NAD(P)-dependent dehydrogenase (short-subunit alcohol dehydrogenase family)